MVTPLIMIASLLTGDLKNYLPVSGLSFFIKTGSCVVAKELLNTSGSIT